MSKAIITERTPSQIEGQKKSIRKLIILDNALHLILKTNSKDPAQCEKARFRFINNIIRNKDKELECWGCWNLEVSKNGFIHYHVILNFPHLTNKKLYEKLPSVNKSLIERIIIQTPEQRLINDRSLMKYKFGQSLFNKWNEQCKAVGIMLTSKHGCNLFKDFNTNYGDLLPINESVDGMVDYFTKPDPVHVSGIKCRYRIFNKKLMMRYGETVCNS